jgi:hypothetical protein
MTFSATSYEMDPMDIVENLAIENNWTHERYSNEQMIITKEKKWGTYTVVVSDIDTFLRFTSIFPYTHMGYAELEFLRLLNMTNVSLTQGSFYYVPDVENLAFEMYYEFDDDRPVSSEYIKNKIDLMVSVIDRFFPCFMAIAGSHVNEPDRSKTMTCINPCMSAEEAFTLAIPRTLGRA